MLNIRGVISPGYVTHEAVSPRNLSNPLIQMLTLFIFYKSTDRIGYRQFRFGARRLTVAQPTYAGFLIGLETDTQVPAASHTAGAKLSVCDSGGGEEVESWRIPVSTIFLDRSLRVTWLSSA